MNFLYSSALTSVLAWGGLAADEARFAIGEWQPYTGQSLDQSGMVSEVVSAACRAAGLKASFTFFPWKRAESNVEMGTFFATFPYQATGDRAQKFRFSDTLYKSASGVLFHKGNPRTAHVSYGRVEDLKGLRVGTLAGSDAIAAPLRRAGIEVEEVQVVEQNLKKLETGRIDCVIDDRPVLFLALARSYPEGSGRRSQFWFADTAFGPAAEYKLLVSRKYPGSEELLERFNTGLRRIKQSGEYQRILKKYGM
jgi:polar amino acid transport system substrate-binding protein